MIAVLAATTPTPAPTTSDGATVQCHEEAEGVCAFVYDLTRNAGLARAVDWIVAKPLAILLIIGLALLTRFLVRRAVDRVVRRLADGHSPSALLPKGRTRSLVESASPVANVRRKQRTEAMGSVLKSIASFVIAIIAILMVLSELGLDV